MTILGELDLIAWGNSAIKDPDGNSPLIRDLSNSEFLTLVGSQGFFAADQDGNYLYSDPIRFFRLGVDLAPYWPMQVNYELSAINVLTRMLVMMISLDKYQFQYSI